MSNAKVVGRRASLWTHWGGPILTLALALLLERLARTPLYIPIPEAFLVLAVVFSVIGGGFRSGLISAAIAWIYIAYFFSQPSQPFQYTDDNLRRVILWAVVMLFLAVIVDYLNRRATRALAQAEIATIQQNQLEEHIRARQALEASEQRYRMLIDQASDGIFVADAQGRFLEANPRGCEMLGYTREELLRLNMADLIPKEDLVSQPIRFDELRAGKSLVSERRLKRKDGTLLQVEISAKILPDGRLQGIVRDITERKWAEEALRGSEERYRTVITGVPIILFALDRKGIITLSEGKGLEGLGLRPGQLVGASVFDVYQDRPDLLANCRRALAGERFTNVVETGGTFLETQWAPLYDSNGSFVGTIGVSSDITERKRAEDELRRNREAALQFSEQLAVLQEVTNQLSTSESTDDLCQHAVQLARSHLGFDRVSIWFVEEHLDIMQGSFGIDEHGELRDERNTQVKFRPEGLAWQVFSHKESIARVEHRPLHDHTGRVVGEGDNAMAALWDGDDVIGVISVDNLFNRQPITERQLEVLRLYATTLGHLITLKRAEEALRASEARFRTFVDHAADAFFLFDDQARILDVNRQACENLGYTREELIGMTPITFDPYASPSVLTRINARLNAGETFTFETRHRRKDGTIFPVEVHSRPFWQGGRSFGVALARDITERKRTEEALRESEERYRLIITGAPIILYAIDRKGIITLSEGKGLESLGFQPGQLVGDSVFDLYRDRPDLLAIFQRALTGERFTNVAEVGGIFLETQWAPLYDAHGSLVGTIGVSSDITERKRAEEQLAASEAELRALFTAMTDVVLVLDRQGRYLKIAPTNPHLLYRPAADLLGKGLHEVFPTAKADYFLAQIQDALAKKQAVHFEYDLQIDEKETWFAATVSPMTDETVVYVARDITERKLAEENLYHRLAELEAISTISAALRTAETLDEMLPILLDETLSALNSTAGSISLYEPENDVLRIAVARGWFEYVRESPIKPSEGIAGTVFVSGQTHISREFATDPLTHPSAIESIPMDWGGICVPIRAAAEVVGVMFVSVRLPREITPGEAKLLSSLAAMAGTAMHRLRLHEETVRHLENLQALHTVDRAITASLDSRLILHVLLEQVSNRLGVDAAGVLLFNSQSLTLEYAAGRGFRTGHYERSHLRLGEGLAGRAALERRLIQVDYIFESPEFLRAGLLRGEGFTAYVVVPFLAKGQVKGVLEVFHRTLLRPDSEWYGFLDAFAHQAAIAIDNIQLFEGLQRSNRDLILTYDATIEGWGRALELRDQETEGHTQRVTEMTERLARALDISDKELIHIRRGSLLHDIGKMGVPDGILLKPGPLNEAEWTIMRLHPQYAFEMLASIPYLHLALDIPYCHHEKWDGTGYPRGLVGEQIPLAARIFAVVDVWDALRSDRPYRHALPEEKVLEYIREQAGKQFDPKIVEQFFRLIMET